MEEIEPKIRMHPWHEYWAAKAWAQGCSEKKKNWLNNFESEKEAQPVTSYICNSEQSQFPLDPDCFQLLSSPLSLLFFTCFHLITFGALVRQHESGSSSCPLNWALWMRKVRKSLTLDLKFILDLDGLLKSNQPSVWRLRLNESLRREQDLTLKHTCLSRFQLSVYCAGNKAVVCAIPQAISQHCRLSSMFFIGSALIYLVCPVGFPKSRLQTTKTPISVPSLQPPGYREEGSLGFIVAYGSLHDHIFCPYVFKRFLYRKCITYSPGKVRLLHNLQ